MKWRHRLERVERGLGRLRPDAKTVESAMARFRSTGELPEDAVLARCVTDWAESGVNQAAFGDDHDSRAALFRHCIATLHDPRDEVMSGLYDDAVYAPQPGREIARTFLMVLAGAGLDPSTQLWLKFGWPTPTMTCSSVAMSLAGYPTRFVHRRHRPRAKALMKQLRAFAASLGKDEVRIDGFFDAALRFQDAGELPEDQDVMEAVLKDAELGAYIALFMEGEDSGPLIVALEKYWAADWSDRRALLAGVRAATIAGPTRTDPSLAGRVPHLLRNIRWFIRDATDKLADLAQLEELVEVTAVNEAGTPEVGE